jgi:hypothetical protein
MNTPLSSSNDLPILGLSLSALTSKIQNMKYGESFIFKIDDEDGEKFIAVWYAENVFLDQFSPVELVYRACNLIAKGVGYTGFGGEPIEAAMEIAREFFSENHFAVETSDDGEGDVREREEWDNWDKL